MNLMEKFADPQLIHGLSMGEKLTGSGITALMGMGVTFLVLIFLWGCIALMNRVTTRSWKASRQQVPAAGKAGACVNAYPGAVAAPMQGSAAYGTEGSGARTAQCVPVAVMTAVICAYEGSSALRIRKICRAPGRHYWSQPVNERKVIK